MSAREQVKALFGIDPEDADQVFEGWHIPGNHWNGWATPAFDRDQAVRVMAWFMVDPYNGSSMTWDGDVIVYVDGNYAWDESDYEPDRIESDAEGRYPIGCYSWCWQLVEPPEGEDLTTWLLERARRSALRVKAANTALNAVYAAGGDVTAAVAASEAAGQAALEADTNFHDPAYEMPGWYSGSQHAWRSLSPMQQLAAITVHEHDNQ